VPFPKYNKNDQVKEDEMCRACSTYGKWKAYKIIVGKPEGRGPLGRPRRRQENKISMNLREIGWGGMDWVDLALDRNHWRALVNTIMNFRVP
jgi:hypothetical protein